MEREIDLKAAINAISDVVQNRPRPLREIDQIYMKTGDMVLQSELIAYWAKDKKLAFIGDGDAISISIAYLKSRGILDYGPSEITVFDFDERICNAVRRFAETEKIEFLHSRLYNCIDPFPACDQFDCFYTNPPWGASNGGESVNVFVGRGMEAVGYQGEGVIVIADDETLDWPQQVLASVQLSALNNGFFVQQMTPRLHSYHLDDAPYLKSCNLFIKNIPGVFGKGGESQPVTDETKLANFYGNNQPPTIHYVRERNRVDYGKANKDEYNFEMIEKDIYRGD